MNWQPAVTAPRDGTPIMMFHQVWNTPVAVRWRPDVVAGLPWVEVTLTSAWPVESFSHWAPLPEPPADVPHETEEE